MSPGRAVLSASRPARPRPAAPPCAPTRPARDLSLFWMRQVSLNQTRLVPLTKDFFLQLSESRLTYRLIVPVFCKQIVFPSRPALQNTANLRCSACSQPCILNLLQRFVIDIAAGRTGRSHGQQNMHLLDSWPRSQRFLQPSRIALAKP